MKYFLFIALLSPLFAFSQDTTVAALTSGKSVTVTIKNGLYSKYDLLKIGDGTVRLGDVIETSVISGISYRKFSYYFENGAFYGLKIGDPVSLIKKHVDE